MKISLLAFVSLLLLTGCYTMPSDDEFCVVPTTNNPSVTNAKCDSPIPQLGY
jgi:hypothetical protein